MSIYRCACCGSGKVMIDSEANGISYDYKKGAIGTVLLGSGGSAAGIVSNKRTVYKCPDCGVTLSYCLDPEMTMVINAGVTSKELRDNLVYKNVPITWQMIKNLYKNIEEGNADQEEKELEAKRLAEQIEKEKKAAEVAAKDEDIQIILEKKAQIIAEDIAYTPDQVPEAVRVMQEEWQKQYDMIQSEIQNEIALLSEQRKNEYANEVKQIKDSYELEKSKLQDEIAKQTALKEQLNKEYSTLGFFKGARKKEIEKKISEINTFIGDTNYKIKGLEHDSEEKIKNLSLDKQLGKIRTEVVSKYDISKSPLEVFENGNKRKLLMKQIASNTLPDKPELPKDKNIKRNAGAEAAYCYTVILRALNRDLMRREELYNLCAPCFPERNFYEFSCNLITNQIRMNWDGRWKHLSSIDIGCAIVESVEIDGNYYYKIAD